jgi:outer membrane protein TolC
MPRDQERVAARLFNESRGINSDLVPETVQPVSVEMIDELPLPKKTEQREDVKAVQANVEVLRSSAIISREERLSRLDLFANLSTNGLDPTFQDASWDAFNTNNPAMAFGAQLEVPLDFSKSRKARNAYSKQIMGAEKNYQHTLLQQETSWTSLSQQWNDAKTKTCNGP